MFYGCGALGALGFSPFKPGSGRDKVMKTQPCPTRASSTPGSRAPSLMQRGTSQGTEAWLPVNLNKVGGKWSLLSTHVHITLKELIPSVLINFRSTAADL